MGRREDLGEILSQAKNADLTARPGMRSLARTLPLEPLPITIPKYVELAGRDGVPQTMPGWQEFAFRLDREIMGLAWRSEGLGVDPERTPTPSVLDQFIKLREYPPDQFPTKALAFAHKWGVLGLCPRHWLPATHDPECAFYFQRGACGFEPLEVWDFYVRQVCVIVRIAAALHQGQAVSYAEWTCLYAEPAPPEGSFGLQARYFLADPLGADWQNPLPLVTSLGDQRTYLMALVRRWLIAARVGPWPVWTADVPTPQMQFDHGGTTFGLLALQLAFAVMRVKRDALAVCDACGEPFTRALRGRRTNLRVWCSKPECRREAARITKRGQRAGNRRWKRGDAEGKAG